MSQTSTTAQPAPGTGARHLERVAKFAGQQTITSVSRRVAVLSASSIAEVFAADMRFLWRDPSNRLHAASGTIAQIRASGKKRFAHAQAQANSLYARVEGRHRPVYGGFAFEPGGASSAKWAGFGDARFELPRISYVAGDGDAELAVNLRDPSDPLARRAAVALLEEMAEAIANQAARTSAPRNKAIEAQKLSSAIAASEDRPHYLDLVGDARETVRGGRLAKVVVAREKTIELGAQPQLTSLVGGLDSTYPDCYLLCVKGDAGTLVAASPERLVELVGDRVKSVALAGTVAPNNAEELLSDAKLQLEHRLTAQAIAAALSSSGCDNVTADESPTLRRLRHLVHLETRVAGRRKAGAHLFEVAAALHPSAAVAGIPTSLACEFIRENEQGERGWYAGLVGWCDSRGDGELAVALRAGLLHGNTASLFAGAGIVADSDPSAELAETALKFSALESHLHSDG